jgi:hypothetical protein
MPASVVSVTNLDDPRMENEIKQRLETALKKYLGWRITVQGAQEHDDWEIKGENPSKQKSWTALPIRFEDQTVENVIQVVMENITSLILEP